MACNATSHGCHINHKHTEVKYGDIIHFCSPPRDRFVSTSLLTCSIKRLEIQALEEFLTKNIIEEVPDYQQGQGVYSQIFPISKP